MELIKGKLKAKLEKKVELADILKHTEGKVTKKDLQREIMSLGETVRAVDGRSRIVAEEI